MQVSIVNAFIKTPEGGNPAGVVLDAESLSVDKMQAIAKKAGFSETAFVQPSEQADFKVRFFTPDGEVDLCGHATIATFSELLRQHRIQPGQYRQETLAGVLDVTVADNGEIWMNQCLPEFAEEVSPSEVAGVLNCQPSEFLGTLPNQVVSTGLRDLLVPVRDLKTLLGLKPDFQKVIELSKKYQTVGMHLFSLETLNRTIAHCRNLAPLYGINEEAATGTSTGALSCYLYYHGQISPEQAKHLVFEQGYGMHRPSEILGRLTLADKKIQGVQVGGKAAFIQAVEI